MEYAADMEEKAHTQVKGTIKLESSVEGHTFLTNVTDYATSVVTMGGANKDLKNLRVMMK